MVRPLAAVTIVWLTTMSSAPAGAQSPAKAAAKTLAGPDASECLAALDELGVSYRSVKRRGIDIGIEVRGLIDGIEYRSYNAEPLVLDCSAVYSLARAGQLLRAHGVERVHYSSAYQRRNVRGTNRPSRHSFGLAIDIHTLVLAGREEPITLRDDYEQGLGDNQDCVGQPLTEAGAIIRGIDCQLSYSGLFRIVLSPDYDADHYNHFHLEALPWSERTDRDPHARLDAAWQALDRVVTPLP